jgi:hypothetical protein
MGKVAEAPPQSVEPRALQAPEPQAVKPPDQERVKVPEPVKTPQTVKPIQQKGKRR